VHWIYTWSVDGAGRGWTNSMPEWAHRPLISFVSFAQGAAHFNCNSHPTGSACFHGGETSLSNLIGIGAEEAIPAPGSLKPVPKLRGRQIPMKILRHRPKVKAPLRAITPSRTKGLPATFP
jgi:hypothetical protein